MGAAASGVSNPNGVTDTYTKAGLMATKSSGPSPRPAK